MIIQEFIKRGEAKGLEKGLQKGLKQGVKQGVKQGIKEGFIHGKRATALAMKKKGIDRKTISEVTGLSSADINELK